MKKQKILIVTGTRSEYGLLQWVMHSINASKDYFELQVLTTCMHLSPEFGYTENVIKNDGFKINESIEMLLSSDTRVGTAKSIGLGTIGFADSYKRLEPDLVMVLGDRFELLAASQSAMIMNIPVCHLIGGDVTEGAFDDVIRHCISKMSNIHFVSNAQAKKRVAQLGEDPAMIFNFGSPGLDGIRHIETMSRKNLEEDLNFMFRRKNILVTFHPVTLEQDNKSLEDFNALLMAIDRLGNDVGILFTKPNADPNGRKIISMLEKFAENKSQVFTSTSLGQKRYYSVIQNVDVVVGNSSSGLYEVPSFKKATVNIGDREKGRIRASSVIDCSPVADDIYQSILAAFDLDCSETVNPYGDGYSADRIVSKLKELSPFCSLPRKKFHDLKKVI